MTRQEFFGAILGIPFLAWAAKLDKKGEPTEVIEPVSVPFVQSGDASGSPSVTVSVESTYSDGTTTWHAMDGVLIQGTYTG